MHKKIIFIFIFSFLTLTLGSSNAKAVNFSILKNDRDIIVTYGQDLIYDLEYSNWENRTIENVTFEDSVPHGTTYIVESDWDCDGYNVGEMAPGGTVCTYDYGDILPNQINQVIDSFFLVTIDNDSGYSHVSNTIRVLENGDEIATSTVDTPIYLPEIYSLVTSDREEFMCNEVMDLEVFIDNTGLVPATNLIMQLTLPENTKIISDDWSCDSNVCSYEYGDLAADTEDIVPFQVTLIDAEGCVDGPNTFALDLNSDNQYEDYAYRTLYFENPDPALNIDKEVINIVTIEEDEEYRVTIAINLNNVGEVDLTDIELEEDLVNQLGLFDEYRFERAWSDECDLNESFDGDNNKILIEGLDLEIGESCELYYDVVLKDDENEDYNVTSFVMGDQLNADTNLSFELEFDNDDAVIQSDEEESSESNDDSNNDNDTEDESSGSGAVLGISITNSSDSSDSGQGRVLGSRSDGTLADTGFDFRHTYVFGSLIILSVAIVPLIKRKE